MSKLFQWAPSRNANSSALDEKFNDSHNSEYSRVPEYDVSEAGYFFIGISNV